MEKIFSLAEIDSIAGVIRKRVSQTPKVGLILGSGLGGLADSVNNPVTVTYDQLPEWPVSTVEGHQGKLVLGKLEGQNVLVVQGRVHYYEGYSMQQVTLSVRVMQRLGVETLIVTNAAGAINPDFIPGDLMLIVDHLSPMTMSGTNPLRGPNNPELGTRFPDMSQAYDRNYMEYARETAKSSNLNLREGVYAYLGGPTFETPAELRFLRVVGADAVGMSTVPEVIVARHAGIRVLGFSGVTNKANLDGNTITTHEEVLSAAHSIVPKLTDMICGVLRRM